MSTEFETKLLTGKLMVTSFFGGVERGSCIQLTLPRAGTKGFVQLTNDEVRELVDILNTWLPPVREPQPETKPLYNGPPIGELNS